MELKPGEGLTLEELQEFLADKMAKYKIPKYLVIVEALPRTVASEKVRKFVLKESTGNRIIISLLGVSVMIRIVKLPITAFFPPGRRGVT